jgi:hypothetical protein
MFLYLAVTAVVCAAISGVASHVYFWRYVSARASESGAPADAGRADDSGLNAYDREVLREVLSGKYQAKSPEALLTGRTARRFTFTCASFTALAILSIHLSQRAA